MEGISVTRLPLFPSHDGSGMRRVINYISFAISAVLYGVFGAKSADVIYVYHPPLTVGLAAAVISAIRRIPFVYDVQDLWPDTLRATGMVNSNALLSLTEKMCNWVYRRASHIVVLSEGFRQRLAQRGVPIKMVSVIHNWCDESALKGGGLGADVVLPEGFNVVFAGNMGHAQALHCVLDAAEILDTHENVINFIFVGSGLEKLNLENSAKQRGLSNVRFMPRLPVNEVGTLLRAADALLVHLRADELFRITIPSKTQAYMAIGRPIIMAVEGDAKNLVIAAGAGVCCHSENPKELVKVIGCLAEKSADALLELGENGRQYYCENLSLQVGTRKFINVFEQVTRN